MRYILFVINYAALLILGILGWTYWTSDTATTPKHSLSMSEITEEVLADIDPPSIPQPPSIITPTNSSIAIRDNTEITNAPTPPQETPSQPPTPKIKETERLIHLAAQLVIDNPQQAVDILSEASLKDPHNADIHLYIANLHESMHNQQEALNSYIRSVQHAPNNIALRELLVDFYLRHQQYTDAMQVLQDALDPPTSDSLWLKALFWSRITIPIEPSLSQLTIPTGPLKSLDTYLKELPQGIFWNENAFASVDNNEIYLKTQQETFWLRLFSCLKTNNETAALTLLQQNPFQSESFAPDLEKALTTILIYRNTQKQNLPLNTDVFYLAHITPDSLINTSQAFLNTLKNLSTTPPHELDFAIPQTIKEILTGPEAFAIACLAAGWNEAALQLHRQRILPETTPSWVISALIHAIQINRGTDIAAKVALEQIASPQVEIIQKELLAQIAIQNGDILKATAYYKEIETKSNEAKSYLASKAFSDKDWARAKTLTEELLKEYPDNPKLLDNLKKITAQK